MIKIKPYNALPEKEGVFNLYLYIAANAMPFYPEDVFLEGYFYKNGNEKTDICLYKRIKQQRKRTERHINLLKKYHVPLGNTPEKRIKSDAVLAKKIIRNYSKELYIFLYKWNSANRKFKNGRKTGHVNPDNLRKILTASVSFSGIKKLPFVDDALKAGIEEKKELLDFVFCYDSFSAHKRLHDLVNYLGVEVCPYCNRLFTTTVAEGKKKMRPQLDHFRSKSQYPFLALSILNLVPCCGVCNQIKQGGNREILYPYEEEMGEFCSFRVDSSKDITILTGTRFNKSDLTILFENKDATTQLGKRINESIEVFNLENVYKSHKGYVAELLFQRYIFTDEMLKDIADSFPSLFSDETEVREMLLLNKLNREHWKDRPLGKLIHDILEELDILYNKSNSINNHI